MTLAQQSKQVLAHLSTLSTPFAKYLFLRQVMDSNETLFYYTLIHNVKQLMPVVYTPVVGEACVKYSSVFAQPRGLFLNLTQRGRLASILSSYHLADQVRVIVVTDGERILGLGDLGANGMGIPIGKLTLYTACAGVPPQQCLPITLDMGTNNETNLADPNYIGLRQKRLPRGSPEYDMFLDEFIQAVRKCFPAALLQWEDFGNANAFRLLHKYENTLLSFNDDIQGTACVVLGGLVAATRLSSKPLEDHRFLFLGAGEAGVGIGDLICESLMATTDRFKNIEEARQHCYFVDSRGLVCKERKGKSLSEHKLPYAHDVAFQPNLIEAVRALRPTAIIGVSAQPQTFTQEVIKTMCEFNDRPIVFALSNPTSKAECTAEQAYQWSQGKAIFASGSPFDPVVINGQKFIPGQGNNAYIFPGIGLGVIAVKAKTVPQSMFLVAAKTLAELVDKNDSEKHGLVYPRMKRIREVSYAIAVAVAKYAIQEGNTTLTNAKADDAEALVSASIYEPSYDGDSNGVVVASSSTASSSTAKL
eukprot:CAMPEP_0201546096 /NCGR_PEP_ID=MMETSP0173_2-20130828/2479_1 /ASSEMBLY_ACC=CAM_ASM_000268 /TAXON_ID=218659 /ORGANISM="Vexillifera sp., Strain DIVA3 564/2" /LENGTH=531 /DNA_ID=CAMNT_0047954685 /DNA_START=127 /DNA_END=1722 /DNA_ORIENTATION=+